MKKQGHRNIHTKKLKPGQKISPSKRRKPKRKLSLSFTQATQYKRDIFRGGKPLDIIRLMEGQTTPDSMLENPEQDIDIILENESDVSITDDDGEESIFDQMRAIGREDDWGIIDDDAEETWQSDYTNRIPIFVIDGEAIFREPEWAISYNEPDLKVRWETYVRITSWLNQEKQDFLRKPSFFALASGTCDPAEPISVLQKDLHKCLGLQCHITTFSKHIRNGLIVWPTMEFSLSDLWSQQARIAWCAQVALNRQKALGYASINSSLGNTNIQPPRNTTEFIKSYRASAYRLGPSEFVELLCALTGCKWSDVLNQYAPIIFYEESVNE